MSHTTFLGRHNVLHIPVRIRHIPTGEEYIANKLDECKNLTDEKGYNEAICCDEVILIDKTCYWRIDNKER
jgi:hypothetical protein